VQQKAAGSMQTLLQVAGRRYGRRYAAGTPASAEIQQPARRAGSPQRRKYSVPVESIDRKKYIYSREV